MFSTMGDLSMYFCVDFDFFMFFWLWFQKIDVSLALDLLEYQKIFSTFFNTWRHFLSYGGAN